MSSHGHRMRRKSSGVNNLRMAEIEEAIKKRDELDESSPRKPPPPPPPPPPSMRGLGSRARSSRRALNVSSALDEAMGFVGGINQSLIGNDAIMESMKDLGVNADDSGSENEEDQDNTSLGAVGEGLHEEDQDNTSLGAVDEGLHEEDQEEVSSSASGEDLDDSEKKSIQKNATASVNSMASRSKSPSIKSTEERDHDKTSLSASGENLDGSEKKSTERGATTRAKSATSQTSQSIKSDASKSMDGGRSDESISIDDIEVPGHYDGNAGSITSASATSMAAASATSMTDGLSVMEKLQLASKLDSSRGNMFLKELLQTSIRDLEAEKKKKKRRSKSSRDRTPSSHRSRRHKHKKKGHRSREGQGHTPSSHHSRAERSFYSSTDSIASGLSATSTTAAIPKEVYRTVFSRIRGGEPLPRDDLVSSIIRKLLAHPKSDNTFNCVALIPSDDKNTVGIGKSTLAGLICSRQDIRMHYHKAIGWVDLQQQNIGGKPCPPMDFDQYSTALHGILAQCGISSRHLKLNHFVKTPCEDAALADIRSKIYMKEARIAMGKILSSSRNFPKKRKAEQKDCRKILIVLDNLMNESDKEWFVFRYRGEKEVINDVLITSNKKLEGLTSIPVPPLSEEEGLKLVLMEANLQSNHQVSKAAELAEILKCSMLHPLLLKYIGRWLNLKRTTGSKGIGEILREIKNALNNIPAASSPVDVIYAMLDQAITPLVSGAKTNTVRLCLVSFLAVFTQEFCKPSIPLKVANDFFTSVVESKALHLFEGRALSCPLYIKYGKHASKLVPEILGALGIVNVTKHSTKDKSIQIDHNILRLFGGHVLKDEAIQKLLDTKAIQNLHKTYAKENLDEHNWNNLQPNRAQIYAIQFLPRHMFEGGLYDSAQEILSQVEFITTRISNLGLVEGTRIHLEDIEAFSVKFSSHVGCEASIMASCTALESVLTKKVNNDSTLTLDIGRCIQLIGISLGKIGLSEDASKIYNRCIEIIYSCPPSDAVASIMYNTSLLYLDDNMFDSAREVAELVVEMRGKLHGDDSVPYARALFLSGDIAFQESDYSSAESFYKRSINIFAKFKPCNLDLGASGFMMGRTDYELGSFDDALKCYNESSEFAESELPFNHEHFVNMYYYMGNALMKKGCASDAVYAFKEALTLSKEVKSKSHDLVIRVFLIGGALQSANGEHVDAIENYRGGLNLLRKYAPGNERAIGRLMSLIAAEYILKKDVKSAIEWFQEAIQLMKRSLGSNHLDVANALVSRASLEHSLEMSEEASRHLEQAIHIQKSINGDCDAVAINFSHLGDYLKAAGDDERALDAYTNSILILTERGDLQLQLTHALLGLADLLNKKKEYTASLGHYNDCLQIQKILFSENHEKVAITKYQIATVKMKQGLYDKALRYLNESVDIMTSLNGKTHPFIGDAYNLNAFLEMKKGNAENALKLFNDALQVRKALGDRTKEAETLKNIGHVYREKNDYDLALEQYEECLGILTEEKGRDSDAVADILIAMGDISSDMSSTDDAMSHYKNALQKLLKHYPEVHDKIASLLQRMGMMLFRSGNLERALLYLNKSGDINRQLGGDQEHHLIPTLFVVGNIHRILGHDEDAENAWRDAYDVFGSIKGGSSYLYPEIKGSLTELLNARRGNV